MKRFVVLPLLLLIYGMIAFSLSSYLQQRPLSIKLGYTPPADAIQLLAGEHKYSIAAMNIIRVLFYYGTFSEEYSNRLDEVPDYGRMYEALVQSIKLDPYNMDAYYFAQASFTWELGRIREVNKILEYGMKYRTDNYRLPFWIGFNSAFFLKDYKTAAKYMQKAAEISASTLFTNLAARYFYEAKQEDLGIIYLDGMIRGAKDEKIRHRFQLRRDALVAVKKLQEVVDIYWVRRGIYPENLEDLVGMGLLASIPVDPYGGSYSLDISGRVKSSSQFILKSKKTVAP